MKEELQKIIEELERDIEKLNIYIENATSSEKNYQIILLRLKEALKAGE